MNDENVDDYDHRQTRQVLICSVILSVISSNKMVDFFLNSSIRAGQAAICFFF